MRLVLRKLFFLAMCVTLSISGFAQRDIKTFDKIGRDAIIAILGQPDGNLYWGGVMEGADAVQYPDTYVCLDESTSELVGFNTTSPEFCVLSDYIQGGFKVGDSFAKLKNFDFVHSKYGKNRPGNALELVDSSAERDYYAAYGQERKMFFFSVKDGVIIGIDLATMDEDAASYLKCDMDNSPW